MGLIHWNVGKKFRGLIRRDNMSGDWYCDQGQEGATKEFAVRKDLHRPGSLHLNCPLEPEMEIKAF